MDRHGLAKGGSHSRFATWAGIVTLAMAAWAWQLVAFVAADGSDVAGKLGQASSVVGALSSAITNDSQTGGEYADQNNARSVPFLGGTPGRLLPGLFNALGPLTGFDNFAPGDDDFVKVVDDKVNQVDGSLLGDNNFPVRVYTCGAAACKLDTSQPDASKIRDLTSVELQLAVGSSSNGTIDFDSLGLPSIGFAMPKDDATKLNVDLSWSIAARLIADGNGLRLAPSGDSANPHELTLGATISLPTKSFTVNLGALVVKATEETAPQFTGSLRVDIDENGNFGFGFGPESGFKARWGLATDDTKSPLKGIQGDLDIQWSLSEAGVNADGLTITVADVKIDTTKLLGDDLQEAAAALREVTHPIRTVTSPLLEPIPGLSDISEVFDGGDVTLLRIMEEANGFPPELRTTLKRLQALDDAVSALAGDGPLELGSFTLLGKEGGEALKPLNQALTDKAAAGLQNIYDKCTECQRTIKNLLQAVNGGETPGAGGFKFDLPVLRQPASLAGLLLGRDVELITFDTDRLGYPKNELNIPLGRFLIFSAKIGGEIEASIHLKGGVDTKGISDALKSGGSAADVLNGVYLQNPDNGGPVVRLVAAPTLAAAVGIEVVEARLEGGPDAKIILRVPASAPDGKLRPAIAKDGIGCALLEADDAIAEFKVLLKAVFDYWIDEEEEVLAEHTFLTEQDLCEPDAKDIEPAYPEGRTLVIRTAAEREVPESKPDSVKVFMRHDFSTTPPTATSIVVTVNDNNHKDYAAKDFDLIRYISTETRPVMFDVVRSDEIPFEKDIWVETGDGDDDVLVDSANFSRIAVNGGNDNVIVTAGGSLVSGGAGDDDITGGNNSDILSGGADNDTVNGGGGVDILNGDTGIDVILDSSGSGNCLSGGADNDLIISGPGADYLNGDDPYCGPDDPNSPRDPLDDGSSTDGSDDIVTGGGGDIVVGGGKDDEIRLHSSAIADRENAVWRAGVRVHGNGGNDDITTGNGQDWIHGGSGDDVINSDNGPLQEIPLINGDTDTVYGGLGADMVRTIDGDDLVYGDNGTDSCTPPIAGQPAEADTAGGADEVHGGNGADRIALEAGNDKAYGGDGDDVICGHAGDDDPLDGDGDDPLIGTSSGDDTVFGGTGGDTVNGGPGADELFGNDGVDTVNGGDDDDRIVGGSSAAATADAGDTLRGDAGLDALIGDNGSIASGPPVVPSVYDLFANNSTLGGNDTIEAGDDADRAYGGIGNDTIKGGNADDHLEGNNGDDAIYGDANEDDIIGGTSPESLPNAAAGQTAADAADGGETILSGGAGRDVILGDNGVITRPGGTDPIIGGVARAVTLLDRDRTGAALDAVSGGDYIEGNEDPDRIYGEGGNDYVKGNESDDFIEGNQDADRLEGNDGEDDLIGGSSFTSAPGLGDPDAGDNIAGGAGADVILGDNAAITRATTGVGTGFDWDTVANNWLGPVARRSITLLDKATLNAGKFGDDVLSGGAGEDVAFGQDGADSLHGGSHDDYQEGNGGNDVLFGDQVAPPTGDAHESGQPQLDGPAGPAGQDDQIGGSSWLKAISGGAVTGQRDSGDELHGDANADVQLGDNGKILRRIVNSQYQTYEPSTGKPTIVRQAASMASPATALPARFDVGAAVSSGVWGGDTLYGDDGDDLQLAQDGDDTLYGGANDDDMYGELGNDRMFGEAGEDAMIGDRGVLTNRLVTTPGAAFSVSGPPQISFTPYAAHPLDRRVDLQDDGDGMPLQAPGLTSGGSDFMRGGPDHDSMHGAAGNDLMNGDSGGDYLFGDNGVDVMWGGKGRECATAADLACNSDHGLNDSYVDYLFGGHGLKTDPVTGGADILDFRPRPGVDPAAWFEITSTRSTDAVADHQHHQGIDWIYGGWDRDVMQADIADNGPNQGDRLMDWTGAYNLYNHCPAAYGGYNDVRQFSPSMQSFLQQLAFALGAGKSLADVQTKGTSGYVELALVYNADVKANSGSAYPTTPGHFDQFSCEP